MDELATLYEIPSRVGREYNYNKLLSVYNDALQGKSSHLGIVVSVTKEAMEDPARGVFSFEPLKSRLAESSFEQDGAIQMRDMAAPVIKLSVLNPGEIWRSWRTYMGFCMGIDQNLSMMIISIS